MNAPFMKKPVLKAAMTAMLVGLSCLSPANAQTSAAPDVMVVFDASGSMWGQIDGISKIEIARDAFVGLSSTWGSKNVRAGLMAYGHRRKGDCNDIELISRPSVEAAASMATQVNKLTPKGKTPLSAAVRQAADVMKFQENAATVILVSDGIETCNLDPCAVGKELETLGIDFTAHVIGFGIEKKADKAQLACLAENTGGKYFDASDSSGLNEAITEVAEATAEPVPAPEPQIEQAATQNVLIRVVRPRENSFPTEANVYLGDDLIGTVPRGNTTKDFAFDLPVGPVELRAEGDGMSGSVTATVDGNTKVVNIQLETAETGFQLWGNGPYPITNFRGRTDRGQQFALKDKGGADKGTYHRVYLVPPGGVQDDAISRANVAPTGDVWNAVALASPATAGDYEIIVTWHDGAIWARLPVTFANDVTPQWRGERVAEPGGQLRAEWSGDANRTTSFELKKGDARPTRQVVAKMHTEDGFVLQMPNEPGVYDLSLNWIGENMRDRYRAKLGQIAVGVDAPASLEPQQKSQVDTSGDASQPTEMAQAQTPDDPDFTAGMREESEAIGGEEGPGIPVGRLHGNWLLVWADRAYPFIASQVNHEKGAAEATGDIAVTAKGWNLGETTGHERLELVQDGDKMAMTAKLSDQTLEGSLTFDGTFWRGSMEYDGRETKRIDVWLLRPKQMDFAVASQSSEPMDNDIIAVDERWKRFDKPVQWTIREGDAQDDTQRTTERGRIDDMFAPGPYTVTAQVEGLEGSHNFVFGEGLRRVQFVVVSPPGEGADLPIEATYYCSPGENCDMKALDARVEFTLPEGWGAERPYLSRGAFLTTFNLATLTPDGPFYVTLNQPQRMAELGPCKQMVLGTFCHDKTDDQKLLADVKTIERSISFARFGNLLNDETIAELLGKFAEAGKGDAK